MSAQTINHTVEDQKGYLDATLPQQEPGEAGPEVLGGEAHVLEVDFVTRQDL